MEKHHKTQLKLLVEELTDTGVAEVSYRDLYRIFNMSRITVSVWRQLLEAIADDLDEDENVVAQQIMVCEPSLKASYIFIYTEGLSNNRDTPPIRPLADLI